MTSGSDELSSAGPRALVPPEAIFFDLGGVVLQQDALAEQALAVFRPRDEDAFWQLFNRELGPLCRGELALPAFWRLLSKKLGIDVSQEAIEDLWGSGYAAAISVDPEVRAIVEGLRRNYRLGIISNIVPEHAATLRRMGILEFADGIFFSHELRMTKHEPELFLLAAKRMGIAPDRAVFIDDVKLYADVAASVGMRSVVFTGARQMREALVRFEVRI